MDMYITWRGHYSSLRFVKWLDLATPYDTIHNLILRTFFVLRAAKQWWEPARNDATQYSGVCYTGTLG
jgi:hypothetical protein